MSEKTKGTKAERRMESPDPDGVRGKEREGCRKDS